MNINSILQKVINLLNKGASEFIDFKLEETPDYQDIVNLWYYHITVSKEYRKQYPRPEYNKNILKQIVKYRKYYSSNVKYIFDKHTFSNENLLLFLIKNQNKLLIFLKSDLDSNIFSKIYLPMDKISKINDKLFNIDDNTIRLLFYQ